MQINNHITVQALVPHVNRTFDLAARKVRDLDKSWDAAKGTPVFTVQGRYTSRGWTEWTQGFQYGCALLVFDATDDAAMLKLGRQHTFERMSAHLTHIGVHDHGFNNLSTYGNLRRLILEDRVTTKNIGSKVAYNPEWELNYHELAIKVSGAVQAARWAGTHPLSGVLPKALQSFAGTPIGYIYSFNGPQSLFVDTMRTTRILGLAWKLGQVLMHENDKAANLLKRSVLHGITTARYILSHGETDHTYDVSGRTSHEALFNRNDGMFRTKSTQQGYSPFSTWTRGLAWALLGYAEELEFFSTIDPASFKQATGLAKKDVMALYEHCARITAEHYIKDVTASDGIPYWDDGAPGLAQLGDWQNRPAETVNDFEPVDSSAAAIAAQGLLRLGRFLTANKKVSQRYTQAGLTVAQTLLSEPYLAASPKHQGLILHSIYHRPNNWDYIPAGSKIPHGESSLWGDYHALELALLIQRMAEGGKYPTFF